MPLGVVGAISVLVPRAHLFLIQSLEGRQGPSCLRPIGLKPAAKVAATAETREEAGLTEMDFVALSCESPGQGHPVLASDSGSPGFLGLIVLWCGLSGPRQC